ncbi:MAG: hypothetical protein P8X98_15045 [Woeseiaceae bacterium]
MKNTVRNKPTAMVVLAAMEGVPLPHIRQHGMAAASLMLCSSELTEDMALPNIRELFDNRIADKRMPHPGI